MYLSAWNRIAASVEDTFLGRKVWKYNKRVACRFVLLFLELSENKLTSFTSTPSTKRRLHSRIHSHAESFHNFHARFAPVSFHRISSSCLPSLYDATFFYGHQSKEKTTFIFHGSVFLKAKVSQTNHWTRHTPLSRC